ncbi:hypothetical protein A2U01_0111078, partial [Trifolium medium]|nr:hypothetical protein [Trifolium medium]
MTARHDDLHLVQAALEVADQSLGPSLGCWCHVGNLQVRAAPRCSVAPVSP